MIVGYLRADAVVLMSACHLPSYHASGKLPSSVYLHDPDYQHRNWVSVEVVMVDENHRRELIGSVLSSTAFCYPVCDGWRILMIFSGASVVAENRENVFYAARFLDVPQEMYVVSGMLGRSVTKMSVFLSSESDGSYPNDVGVLRAGFLSAGLKSENACVQGKSSDRLSSLVTLSDVDALKGDRSLPLNDR